MDFKCKIEIKDKPMEDDETSCDEQGLKLKEIQVSPDDEAGSSLSENIKNEETGQKASVKPELSEVKKKYGLDEGQSATMIEESSTQRVQTLLGDACQREKGSKMKSTSGNRLQMSATHVQRIKMNGRLNFIRRKEELKSHLKTLEKRVVKCHLCDFECMTKLYLERHIQVVHNSIKFRCSECSFECNSKEAVKFHFIDNHLTLTFFECPECCFECNREESLQLHIFNYHNTIKFKCSECSYEHETKGGLTLHMLDEHTTVLFKCSHCNYECDHKETFLNHFRSHFQFKCPDCSYECDFKLGLKLHVLNNHSTLKF